MHYCYVVGRKSVSFFRSFFKIVVSFTKGESHIFALCFRLQVKATHIIKGIYVPLFSCTLEHSLSLFHISSYRSISIFKSGILLKYIWSFKVYESQSIYRPRVVLILFKVINCFLYIFLNSQPKKIYQPHVIVRFHVHLINFKCLFE
jgi:hypothetical protein